MANPTVLTRRLRQLRKDRGLTQSQLSEALDIGFQSLCNYEMGRREPTGRALAKLEQFFGVSGPYLFGLTDEPQAPLVIPAGELCDVEEMLAELTKIQELPPAEMQLLSYDHHGKRTDVPRYAQRNDNWKLALLAGIFTLLVVGVAALLVVAVI